MSENFDLAKTPFSGLSAERRIYALSVAGQAIVHRLGEYLYSVLPEPCFFTESNRIGEFTSDGTSNALSDAATKEKERRAVEELIRASYSDEWDSGDADDRTALIAEVHEELFGRGEFQTMATVKANIQSEFGLPDGALHNVEPQSTIAEVLLAIFQHAAIPRELAEDPARLRISNGDKEKTHGR